MLGSIESVAGDQRTAGETVTRTIKVVLVMAVSLAMMVAPAQGQPPRGAVGATAGPQVVSAAKKPVTIEVAGEPRAGKRFVARGTATAKARVVLSARKPGTKRWTRVGASRVDARGRWRAKVRLTPGGWEVGARSRGRTAVTQVLVTGRRQKAVLRRSADKLTSGQIASVSGDPNVSQTVILDRKAQVPKVGDVLVADASPNAPQGLLGKVVSVDPSSLTAVIEPAALSEAYSTLKVSTASTLGQMTQADSSTSAALASLPVKFKCRSSVNGGGARPTLTARLDMSSTRASFDMDLKRKYIDLFIKGQPTLEAGLSWEAALQAGCEVRLSVPSIPLGPTGLTLDISAALEASLQSGGAVSLTGTAKARFAVGFTVSGSRITYTRGANLAVDWPQLSTSAQTTFELSLKDEVALMVAGRVGIFGDFGPVMEAGITLSGAESCLDVTGALQVGLGLKADLFVTDWKVDLAKAKIGLGHLYKRCAPASTPTPLPSPPVPSPSASPPGPTPPPPAWEVRQTSITTGESHTCALDEAGKAWCWGDNVKGQLGDGTTTAASTPVAVNTDGSLNRLTFTEIDAGGDRTCALEKSGTAYCWGAGLSKTPSAVPGGYSFKAITVGGGSGSSHACSLTHQGTALCWGDNYWGALGDGTRQASTSPVPVVTSGVLAGKRLTAVTAGTIHTCALDDGGAAYCWGDGYHGQLGNNQYIGTGFEYSAVPVGVDTSDELQGKPLAVLSAGGESTCALDRAGKPYCWGVLNNDDPFSVSSTSTDQPTSLGNLGVLPSNKTLVGIVGGGGYTGSGGAHSCGIDSAGKAFCWGNGYFGQLGDGRTGRGTCCNVSAAAEIGGAVAGVSLVEVTAGSRHTCALDDQGRAYCWGRNRAGELGDGSTQDAARPVAVTGGHVWRH